jgi:hypothetical protein
MDNNKHYSIYSSSFGSKYSLIRNHWFKRTHEKCGKNCYIHVITDNILQKLDYQIKFDYAWWDIVRLDCILHKLNEDNKPIVHIDQDIIVEKDIKPLVELPYDIIISTEIGGNKAFPPECSKILGFGVCSGFYIVKPTSMTFMKKILENMKHKKYKSNSDQVNFMNYIVNSNYQLSEENIILDNKTYTNKIITIDNDNDNIHICVLDFNIITRDPIINNGQFANHINIDNVGGVQNFIHYFYEDLEKLPLACRCGKTHLGDTNICKHIEIRKKTM